MSLGGKIPFQLSCFSQDSPPTEVIWEKDGQRIHLNGSKDGYGMTQVLLDKLTSSYVSSLTMDGLLDDVVGEYSCTVVNSLGSSNTMNTTINRKFANSNKSISSIKFYCLAPLDHFIVYVYNYTFCPIYRADHKRINVYYYHNRESQDIACYF